MLTFKKKCFVAYITTDERSTEILGYFANEEVAKLASKGKGWWGSDGNVMPTEINIKIFGTLEEFNNATLEEEKELALSKLTEREKKLLKL